MATKATATEATATLEVYDPISDTWQSRAPIPAPSAAYGLAALNGRLYLFGGWDGTRYVRDDLHL